MVALNMQFDASRVQPAEAGLPIWEGRVLQHITSSEIQNTSKSDGSRMLVLHVTALDGQYAGQGNLIRLNIWNMNPKASEIASRQLSSICHVTGRMQVTDADQLRGAPFIGVWKRETREIEDQQTGKKSTIEGCQCIDFQIADGRTIKEAMNGSAASNPYVKGQTSQPAMQMSPSPQPAPQAALQPGQFQSNVPVPGAGPGTAVPGPQSGFGQPGPQGGFVPPQPQGGPPAGFGQAPGGAPQSGMGFAPGAGFAPGQGGAPQGQGMPGIGTAGSPSSGGFPAPGAPTGGGFGQPAPGGQPGGFPAPGQPGQGFAQPGQGQGFAAPPGAGPWAQG